MKPSELAPGLHRGYPEAEYHAKELHVASNGGLSRILRSPAHYLAWVTGADVGDEPKPFRFGRALHMRTLEPARFLATYVLEPDFGPCRKTDACTTEAAKENKTRRDDWRAAHAGATILDSATGAATLGMIESIANHKYARRLLEGADSEVTLRWDCPDTGIRCKARPDHYREDLRTLIDLKGLADASDEGFAKSAANYGYHRQQTHYTDGCGAVAFRPEHFAFICVEKTAPYLVYVHTLDEDAETVGRRQVLQAKRLMAECLESGVWPGYPEKISKVGLPRWYLQQEGFRE